MIVVDYSQVVISNLLMNAKQYADTIEVDLVRHMVLTSIKKYRNLFKKEYGDMIIAADSKYSWRKKFFPYYKENRKKQKTKSTINWSKIYEVLDILLEELDNNLPYQVLRVDGAEADDIIAVMCQLHSEEPILILSADKDFLQLQSNPNVKQYDPIRDRWLETNDAELFLKEHIIKGDTSDGIPNYLSDDDVFVTNKRQKSVFEKKMETVYLSDPLSEGKTEAEQTQLKENLRRNKILIDLGCIPPTIKKRILDAYNEPFYNQRGKMKSYFVKNRLGQLYTNIHEF